MAGGTLNYKGIEILREVETGKQKYFCGSILPCSATLKRCVKLLEMMASNFFLYIVGHLPNAVEFLQFDYEKTVSTLLKGYGLSDKNDVTIDQSIDGANLTKHLRHVTAGLKINDLRTKDPLSGIALLMDGKFSQSMNMCYPLKIIMCPETNQYMVSSAICFSILIILT